MILASMPRTQRISQAEISPDGKSVAWIARNGIYILPLEEMGKVATVKPVNWQRIFLCESLRGRLTVNISPSLPIFKARRPQASFG